MLSELQQSDCKWYKGELVDLYAEYGDCYAVIHDRRVVATFSTFDEAADYALEELGPGEFIVQEIGPDPSVHTMEIASMWAMV